MQQHSSTDQGNVHEELILACQPWVERIARRFARSYRCEYEEFVSIGMTEVCAATSRLGQCNTNPMAFLCKAAEYAMIDEYYRLHRFSSVSLDAPLSPDGDESFSLHDLLSSCDPAPSGSSDRVQVLYDALDRLPNYCRKTVVQYFGLPGCGGGGAVDTAQALGYTKDSARVTAKLARRKLGQDAELCKAVGLAAPEEKSRGVGGTHTGAANRLRSLLAENPTLSIAELMRTVGCSRSHAIDVRNRYRKAQLVEVQS